MSHVHPHAREDVRSELILAVMEGDIELAEVGTVAKSFVGRFWRDFGDRRSVSMDTQLFDDGGATLGDRLADATAFDADNIAFTSFASRVG